MNRLRLFIGTLIIFLMFFSTRVLAGGGPVEFTVDPNTSLNPAEQYTVYAKVLTNGVDPCRNCLINLGFENPQDSDYVSQNSDRTDNDGKVYAKFISRISGQRTVIVRDRIITTSDGVAVTANSSVFLNYKDTPTFMGPPSMVYPVDGQTLDWEGAYMFKVNLVPGASGYLFGLFQDNIMVYENYRDNHILSSNGEFALWESNPYHAKFHPGSVKVMIRALVNGGWTEAREITIILKPRENHGALPSPITNRIPPPQPRPTPPVIPPTKQIVVITDTSASAALQKKVDELERRLEESQRKQNALEARLNQILNWIKSVFPHF